MMHRNYQVFQEYPNRGKVLELLNEAFGEWGDEKLLNWKFDAYPGFSPAHVFTVRDEGELVALRRLFTKRLIRADGTQLNFFVGGDTCVRHDHRGEGLFSMLVESTQTYCESVGVPFRSSFNRRGGITYKTKVDRGWNARNLPLYVHVLNPEVVLPAYASMAFDESSPLATAATRLLSTAPSRAVQRHLPSLLVAGFVEFASSDHPVGAARHLFSPRETESDATTVSARSVDRDTVSRYLNDIIHLYDSVMERYDLRFKRASIDIEHMLAHPSLVGVVLAERGDSLVGFAPVAVVREAGGVLQANVLDCVAIDEITHRALVQQLEAIAREHGADVLAMLSTTDPGRGWARVDQQVFMWDRAIPTLRDNLFLGLYDVV